MPELPDADAGSRDPAQLRCPMCGAEHEAGAAVCAECGEEFKPELPLDLPNARTLREQIRALSAMHVLLGVFMLAMVRLMIETRSDPQSMFRGSESFLFGAGTGVLAVGHIVVGVGVHSRNLVALRMSIFFSIVTMLLSLWTICLFLLSLLLIAGINQANRIIKLLLEERRQEMPAESES